ncbi:MULTISPECIES: glycerate kinase [unclassified Nocardioides]|uniref:glycerate kinase n=1 Tax=unclassified Nocardioides TaxID=2615069 RepID=UPI00360F0E96
MTGPLVVLAPDKFKGSATACAVADALARGLARTAPRAQVVRRPIADGGEGTVDLLLEHGWEERRATVEGPSGEPVVARWARKGSTAAVEAAAACGLALLSAPPSPCTAVEASTRGVGQLLDRALEPGVTRLVVGVGGTATTDGGRGAVELLLGDRLGRPPGRWEGVRVDVACDVQNPLLGPSGAAATYAPQKGADPATVRSLEVRLAGWAARVAETCGRDVAAMPGAGAGGGLAFGLAAGLGAELVPGLLTLIELTGTADVVRRADLLVVGEGSLDQQSLFGKGPVALAGVAAAAGVPVVAVVGRSLVDAGAAAEAGIGRVHTLLELEPDPTACMARAVELLEQVGAELGLGLSTLV